MNGISEDGGKVYDEIEAHKERLRHLRVTAAKYGIDCPPQIRMEIEDIGRTLEKLKGQVDSSNVGYIADGTNVLSQVSNALNNVEEDLRRFTGSGTQGTSQTLLDLIKKNRVALFIILLLLITNITLGIRAYLIDTTRVTNVVMDIPRAPRCPELIVFSAHITTSGPGLVEYQWEYSDNVKSTTRTITFSEAGTQRVEDARPSQPGVTNRLQVFLRILSPNPVISNNVLWSFDCL